MPSLFRVEVFYMFASVCDWTSLLLAEEAVEEEAEAEAQKSSAVVAIVTLMRSNLQKYQQEYP